MKKQKNNHNFINGLTAAEDERLTVLIEECSEVIKAACKVQRFGYNDIETGENANNLQRLENELGDMIAATDRMSSARDISIDNVMEYAKFKLVTGGQHMHHQGYEQEQEQEEDSSGFTPTIVQ